MSLIQLEANLAANAVVSDLPNLFKSFFRSHKRSPHLNHSIYRDRLVDLDAGLFQECVEVVVYSVPQNLLLGNQPDWKVGLEIKMRRSRFATDNLKQRRAIGVHEGIECAAPFGLNCRTHTTRPCLPGVVAKRVLLYEVQYRLSQRRQQPISEMQ